MLNKLIALITVGVIGTQAAAFDAMPDRVFLNIATKHYGMGEEVFGKEGPNELNPGVGFAWEDIGPGFVFASGFYQDSFAQIAYTGGLSYALIDRKSINLTAGISFTASFGEEKTIHVPSKANPSVYEPQKVERRAYAWPYINLILGNAYIQWRPGLNRELEPAGVFSAGLTFRLKPHNR